MIAQSSKVSRSSITLFSATARVHRLRLTLKILLTILCLLLMSELFFSGQSVLALAMALSIAILLAFYFWASPDTCSVISGMVLWSIAVFITYACWLGNGVFDTIIFGFPCLLMLAIVLSGKLIFISLYSYLVGALCFFAFAQQQNLLISALPFEAFSLWGRVFSYIIILTFFSVGVFFIFADIRERFKRILQKNASLELAISQLRQRSRFDQLTQLPNENACKTDLEKKLKQERSSGDILAFITLNISNLHAIKMNYSHKICDESIKVMAKRLVTFANDKAVIYRFQQNEFVILKQSKDYRGISKFTEKVHQACAKIFHVTDFDVALQPDIGIALAPFDGSTMEELRHNSHLAMHARGEDKKVDFSFFDQAMAVQEQEKLQLTKDLKSAIDNNELVLHFQPKIDLATEQITGAEALIRWISPEHGFIPPTVFIPLAEQAGVITDITHWVIDQSVIACKEWHQLGFNKLCIAVNLSAEDFKRGNLSTYTMSALHQANLPAHFLELELTESMLMDDINYIQKQINELRSFGISFAIDDFGTGYSNLGYLTKFNVCTLKLDRSFVKNICHSSNELQIVKAIIGMSKSLSITNVAEGIEDKATANILAELGCDMGQGYFWSKPVAQADFIALLREKSQ
ncbi:putative bifunctional diguanylate cyclase/phosphodiesterase [Colwellia psychrerythraea]|uniref:Diguanylate cyclase/phosphodiesterase n=1 Tax=Colwellia psychrerythraea TaxID=28229 RepID=A0A099L3T2_COLPS|nr:bifunctional diguanylate cyclase/phosphodiesterase [Colwellia psychrerythraea]KGJ97594.1 diguanylate cyclase/phosphodiesterase [Colwellia psychrerythraea]